MDAEGDAEHDRRRAPRAEVRIGDGRPSAHEPPPPPAAAPRRDEPTSAAERAWLELLLADEAEAD